MLQLGLLVPQCVLFIVTRLIMAAVGALIYGGILIGFCTVVWLASAWAGGCMLLQSGTRYVFWRASQCLEKGASRVLPHS